MVLRKSENKHNKVRKEHFRLKPLCIVNNQWNKTNYDKTIPKARIAFLSIFLQKKKREKQLVLGVQFPNKAVRLADFVAFLNSVTARPPDEDFIISLKKSISQQ